MTGASKIPDELRLVFSTVEDGSMARGAGQPDNDQARVNTRRFLRRNGFPLSHTRLMIIYGAERTYTDVACLDDPVVDQEVPADAGYTTEPGRVITLPVADCAATVVYDQRTGMVGVLHLGRHSSVAGLIEAFAIEVADRVGSDPRDWYVWMSPSLKQPSDYLEFFTLADSAEWREFTQPGDGGFYIDVVGHNRARFMRCGVPKRQIDISPVDTFVDRRYFSHRAAQTLADDSRQGRMLLAVYRSNANPGDR